MRLAACQRLLPDIGGAFASQHVLQPLTIGGPVRPAGATRPGKNVDRRTSAGWHYDELGLRNRTAFLDVVSDKFAVGRDARVSPAPGRTGNFRWTASFYGQAIKLCSRGRSGVVDQPLAVRRTIFLPDVLVDEPGRVRSVRVGPPNL